MRFKALRLLCVSYACMCVLLTAALGGPDNLMSDHVRFIPALPLCPSSIVQLSQAPIRSAVYAGPASTSQFSVVKLCSAELCSQAPCVQ